MMKRTIAMILLALAANAVAQQVRVMVQVIEVPHSALTKWTTGEKLGGTELHDRAVQLTTTGEAEIIETNVLVARSGEKAELESHAEMISPAVYTGVGGGCGVAMMQPTIPLEPPKPLKPKETEYRYKRAFDRAFDGFETRNLGNSLEIEPMIGINERVIDLRLRMEMENRAGLTTWTEFADEWGDASVRTPNYLSQSIVGALTVVAGKFELFNVFTLKPADVPAATTRQLVFVRCDVLPAAN